MKLSPDLYLFNPTCEYAVGNGSPNWQANRLLQNMEADLDILPMFLATSNDFVLVEHLPSKAYLENINQRVKGIRGFEPAFKPVIGNR